MRQRIEQKKNANGPLGIRTGVWLSGFGLVLVSLLILGSPRGDISRPTTETALEDLANQDSSNRPQVNAQRRANIKFTPKVSESVSDSDNDDDLLSMVEQMTQDRRTWMDDPGP